MGQLAQRRERVESSNASQWLGVRRLPSGTQVILEDAERRACPSGDHRAILPVVLAGSVSDAPPARRSGSEEVGEFVDRSGMGLLLVREALGELAAVALAALFERDDFGERDASVAADTVERDLAAVEELVQMCAAHAEAIGSLVWRERRGRLERNDLGTGANGLAERSDDVEHLGRDLGSSALELVELFGRNTGSIDRVHGSPQVGWPL